MPCSAIVIAHSWESKEGGEREIEGNIDKKRGIEREGLSEKERGDYRGPGYVEREGEKTDGDGLRVKRERGYVDREGEGEIKRGRLIEKGRSRLMGKRQSGKERR